MAVFEKWFEQDLRKDLKTRHCEGIVLTGDNLSNLIGVRLYEDGEPATPTGVVTLHAIRADGTTVVDNQGGTISGNAVSFTLKEACMAIPGPLVVLLRLTNGDVKTSILRAVFTVDISESGMIIDPGRVIPSIDELLAMLAEMEEAKDAANQAADDAEGAAASADTATAAANAAANAANTAAGNVNTAIANAQAATTAANNAASAANTAAEGANDAADDANAAAQSATTAAAAANTAAEGADDAADDANQAVADLRQFMKQVTPADTATGRVITFEPTTEGPFIGLEVFGRCEQDIEPSPQLWPETGAAAATGEVNGVTVTGSANGAYAIQGTATADRYLYPNTGALYDAAVTLPAGTYTVNASPGLMVSVRQWASDSIYSSIAYGNPATFTLTASQKITVNPLVPNGVTVDIAGGFVMLSAGETARGFMPYTGEITLPTPAHPRDIATVGYGGTLRMGTVGENLAYMERGALDASGAEVASAVAWRTGYLPMMGACVYASKFGLYTDAAQNLVAHFYGPGMAYQGSENALAYNETRRATELSTLAAAAGALFVRFVQIFPTSSNTPDNTQIMITFGDAGGEYPEYVHATGSRAALLIPSGAGLRGLPVAETDSWNYHDAEGRYWVCDVANYDAGVCTRRVGKTTFADLLNVTYDSSTGIFKTTSPIPTALFENHIMTRIYESVDNDSSVPPTLADGQICPINVGPHVQWKDSRFTSVEDMLAAIGNEPIYYMLRTSSVTYMTDEQKNSFNALRSCDGITHAFAEDAARPYFTASVYSNFLEHLDETVEAAVQIAVSEAVEPIHDEVDNIGERVDDLESYVRDMSPLATVGPADIVSIEDAAPLSVEGLVVDVEPVQAGSGDPSPTNVRPISGWDGVTAKDEGLNLAEFVQDKGIDTSGNVVDHNGRIATVTPIKIESGVAYKFIVFGDENTLGIIAVYNGTTLVRRTANILPNATLNTSGGDTFYFCCYDAGNITVESAKAMIVRSTDAPVAYEPYKSRTASVSFPETIYGCTVDLATGKGEIDRAMVTYNGGSDETIMTGSSGMPIRIALPDDVKLTTKTSELANMYSNSLRQVAQATTWGVIGTYSRVMNIPFVYLKVNDEITTVEAMRTYLSSNPLTFVYELANPITLTLTPAELELFKGVNNISADAGQVTVTYRQDIYTALNNKINELQALVLES